MRRQTSRCQNEPFACPLAVLPGCSGTYLCAAHLGGVLREVLSWEPLMPSEKWVPFLLLLKLPPNPIPGGEHRKFLLLSITQDRSALHFTVLPRDSLSSRSGNTLRRTQAERGHSL